MASVASTLSVDGLSADDEPPKGQKILVGLMLAGTSCILVISGGVNAVKGMNISNQIMTLFV